MSEKSIHCTLTDHELAAKADQWIDELIASGGKSWTMQVPARPNADPDLIFAELNNRFKKLIIEHPKGPVWPLFIVDKNGTKHEVNKVIYNPANPATSHEVHVWCHSWYGHHIIGKDCEWAASDESPAEQPAAWVPAETKPEYNVGLLVFIPGEDNHITSGMWDVSNEWVLLDEYRTPEEEVTHWMPLPAFPEGYSWNEIPDELIDVIKNVAKEELAKRPVKAKQPGREVEAVKFAEWCGTLYRLTKEGWYDDDGYYHTTDQLWELFKKEKP